MIVYSSGIEFQFGGKKENLGTDFKSCYSFISFDIHLC